MKTFKTRNDLIKNLPTNLKICEIGVFRGDFSKILFNQLPNELHLIDPFIGEVWSGDKDGSNMRLANLNNAYEEILMMYKEHKNVYIHKGFSQNILKNFPDNYFDFIYIDGDHSYEGVKNDLMLSKRKVKINGIISGHDFNDNQFPGVVMAVNEFCALYNLSINSLTEDNLPTFTIINK
jgi:hypothetical protein